MKQVLLLFVFGMAVTMTRATADTSHPYGNDIISSTNFVAGDGTWGTAHNFTYGFSNYTADLTQAQIQQAIAAAFQQWNIATNGYFTFTFTTNVASANFKIGFYTGNHGDGTNNAFDGPGTILAHAAYPNNTSQRGQVHFDDAETWRIDGFDFDLQTVAMHEIGHSLGLAHSLCGTAQMWGNYVVQRRTLSVDDIKGIRTIYNLPDNDNLISGGANNLCNTNPSTYTVNLATMRYGTLAWTYTPNLTFVSNPTATSIQVKANTTTGNATLTATVTSCDASIAIRKVIPIGVQSPTYVDVSVDPIVTCNEVRVTTDYYVGATYTWSYFKQPYSGNLVSFPNSSNTRKLSLTQGSGTYTIGVSTTNACGTSSVFSTSTGPITCTGGGGHIVASPNPTKGQVIVALVKNTDINDIKTIRDKGSDLYIDRIDIYNNQGVLVKTVNVKGYHSALQTINLAGMRGGLYQLVVTSGKDRYMEKVKLLD